MRTLVPGTGVGEPLILDQPLSFWGGIDPRSGAVIESSHPQFGESLAGRILVMPHGRGSSSSSSVLAELLRIGLAPAGIILEEPDMILVIGVLVGQTLYGAGCPIVVGENLPEHDGVWTLDAETAEPTVQILRRFAD